VRGRRRYAEATERRTAGTWSTIEYAAACYGRARSRRVCDMNARATLLYHRPWQLLSLHSGSLLLYLEYTSCTVLGFNERKIRDDWEYSAAVLNAAAFDYLRL
jgi:hypothetical protein